MSFSEFEDQLLVGSYLLSEQTGEDMVRAGDVIERYGITWRKGWINKAVQGFVTKGWSGDARTLSDEPDQDVWLTAQGYRRAEELLPYVKLAVRFAAPLEATAAVEQPSIPASDRLVTIDHNNPDVKAAITNARKLSTDLTVNNDVGNLSSEAVAVASREVAEIAQALEGPMVRMPAFSERAKSTLTWIGKEAAGALVGAAALALLALLGTVLGMIL